MLQSRRAAAPSKGQHGGARTLSTAAASPCRAPRAGPDVPASRGHVPASRGRRAAPAPRLEATGPRGEHGRHRPGRGSSLGGGSSWPQSDQKTPRFRPNGTFTQTQALGTRPPPHTRPRSPRSGGQGRDLIGTGAAGPLSLVLPHGGWHGGGRASPHPGPAQPPPRARPARRPSSRAAPAPARPQHIPGAEISPRPAHGGRKQSRLGHRRFPAASTFSALPLSPNHQTFVLLGRRSLAGIWGIRGRNAGPIPPDCNTRRACSPGPHADVYLGPGVGRPGSQRVYRTAQLPALLPVLWP